MVPLFLLITVPFLISGVITYDKYSANEDRRAKEYAMQIIEQVKINLDNYMSDMERMTTSPYYDHNVLSILKAHNLPYQSSIYITNDEMNEMNSLLYALALERPEVQGAFLFTNDGGLFSNRNDGVASRWRSSDNPWMNQVNRQGRLTILPPHEAAYYEEPTEVVSVIRLLREPASLDPIGIIKVDITRDGFEHLLREVSFSPNSRLFLLDKDDELIYSDTDQPLLASLIQSESMMDSVDYIDVAAVSAYSGLQVAGLIPKSDLRGDVNELTRFTGIISVISLIIAYVVAVVLSNHLVKPILSLQRKMRIVQRGDFRERVVLKSNDEVGVLTDSFNTMVGEIDRLVKEVYEVKLREREAELTALQSQINPHFIFNTLESMNMMAMKIGSSELSSLIISLGKLIRYTVDKQETIVYLRDEIAFVDAYLQIQSFRLGDRLNVELDIEPSHEYALLPKLILQPLFENVIEHAIGSAAVTIKIGTRIIDDDLNIIIEDSGAGMSPDRMAMVERRMYESGNDLQEHRSATLKKKGYALRNVHQRIRLLYAEPYGLSIDKSVRAGTRFVLHLPFRWEED
jgi:two-component system, sensor histidine kinase YesM